MSKFAIFVDYTALAIFVYKALQYHRRFGDPNWKVYSYIIPSSRI